MNGKNNVGLSEQASDDSLSSTSEEYQRLLDGGLARNLLKLLKEAYAEDDFEEVGKIVQLKFQQPQSRSVFTKGIENMIIFSIDRNHTDALEFLLLHENLSKSFINNAFIHALKESKFEAVNVLVKDAEFSPFHFRSKSRGFSSGTTNLDLLFDAYEQYSNGSNCPLNKAFGYVLATFNIIFDPKVDPNRLLKPLVKSSSYLERGEGAKHLLPSEWLILFRGLEILPDILATSMNSMANNSASDWAKIAYELVGTSQFGQVMQNGSLAYVSPVSGALPAELNCMINDYLSQADVVTTFKALKESSSIKSNLEGEAIERCKKRLSFNVKHNRGTIREERVLRENFGFKNTEINSLKQQAQTSVQIGIS